MIVGIVKEKAGESRVSLLPEQADALIKRKVNILVEKGAGEQAYASDAAYEVKNIKAVGRDEVLKSADVLLSIHPLPAEEISSLKVMPFYWGFSTPLSFGYDQGLGCERCKFL
jgi:NAD(P) transhydrogenase subunit alpha